jgi:hypothetical protein
MAIFRAHLALRPTFLARLNYGSNTCPPGFRNNYSETIFLLIATPLRLPKSVQACLFNFQGM